MWESGVVLLPSRKTLVAYNGRTKAEIGVTDLSKRRLIIGAKKLPAEQRHVSVMIDEVVIQPKLTYLKTLHFVTLSRGKRDCHKLQLGISDTPTTFGLSWPGTFHDTNSTFKHCIFHP